MSKFVDSCAVDVYAALFKDRKMCEIVRFRDTGVPCWRCTGNLEYYYCESGLYALRCSHGCEGVFLVSARNPRKAADEISGTYVGEIPGGGVPGAAD